MRLLRWIGDNGALLLTIAWIVITAIAVAAPILINISPGIAAALYLSMKPICHQMASRSFFIAGNKMALCTRCTGIFAGLAVFGIISLILRERARISMRVMMIFIAPMAIDGVAQIFGLWMTPNLPRFITGVLAGFGIVFWIYPIIFESNLWERRTSKIILKED